MFLVHTIIPSLARSCANPIISNFEFKSGVRFFSKSKNIIDFGKINIVGDGIGALKFLEDLSSKFYSLKDCHASGEIILYSPSNKIGPGFSYSNENSENYLINNGMDHLGGDSRYLSWLENTNKLNSYQKSISIKTMPYPPRPHFGLYME